MLPQPEEQEQEVNGVPGLLHGTGRWNSGQAASYGEVACQRSTCSRSEEPLVMDTEEKHDVESDRVACVGQRVESKSTHTAVPGPPVMCQDLWCGARTSGLVPAGTAGALGEMLLTRT